MNERVQCPDYGEDCYWEAASRISDSYNYCPMCGSELG